MTAVSANPGARAANNDPPDHWVDVNPSDVTEFTYLTRALRPATAGNIAVEALNESGAYAAVTIPSVAAGETVVGVFRKVLATGTTCTGIVRMW